MEEELYCFEKYRCFTIIGEPLFCGTIEFTIFKHDHRNPHWVEEFKDGEAAVYEAKRVIDSWEEE